MLCAFVQPRWGDKALFCGHFDADPASVRMCAREAAQFRPA